MRLLVALVPAVVVAVVMLAAVAWLSHLHEVERLDSEQARTREHAALANIGRVADLAHQDLAAERVLASYEHDLNLKLQTEVRDLADQHKTDQQRLADARSQTRNLSEALASLRARTAAAALSSTAAAVTPGILAPTPAPVPH